MYLEKKVPTAKTRKLLRLQDGDHVFELKRLRPANDDPVILETQWLPEKLFPDLTYSLLCRESPLRRNGTDLWYSSGQGGAVL